MIDKYIHRNYLNHLDEMVEGLEQSREREIIIRRYGLRGDRPHTQKEVAAMLGISRSYVSRIEKKALKKLRNFYEQKT